MGIFARFFWVFQLDEIHLESGNALSASDATTGVRELPVHENLRGQTVYQ